ncbi:uncharacterized protein PHALS_13002 [Plasmopara halstedii]|uniref:Uncharacterized protein n=1 Tax=Plasmopara halstedii TaxID=4781 RepID=A0A0P1ANC5_PLAHL|nr:uncharacterized protein PHALS_13002 [Plasmopara halstedii]CEG42752.1 hypothetical protein PHALS_13002 [Plasmopara halstedii]|eukprot:XP_024579121.1 hypothetical protein PHALS_13002 [Plasmopara halstedii]
MPILSHAVTQRLCSLGTSAIKDFSELFHELSLLDEYEDLHFKGQQFGRVSCRSIVPLNF